ncbi:MAG: trehalose-phosphatase [candidate division Zixibacteria bacterium]|nr:trehalose-phosphatase [candidate division Zixibacteria bacterium]
MKPPCSRIWVFDFDGTISHLVPERDAAVLDAECRSLLSELADDPNQVVAVISSRSLDDLIGRIDIDDLIVAGSSGLEWVIPGGLRLGPNARAVVRLERERKHIDPTLRRLARIPGVEIEDKTWSAAVHFRHADSAGRDEITKELDVLKTMNGVAVHYGPEVAEVPFLAEVGKKTAVKTLIRLNKSRYQRGYILYAGDDQNDAQAMEWVLAQKGSVYVVGGRIAVPGSHAVDSPTDLARAIRHDCQLEYSKMMLREDGYE